MKQKYKVGQIIRIKECLHGHDFPVGEEVRIKKVDFDGEEITAEYLDGKDFWYVGFDEVEPLNELAS
jgi:hypothetical protein